MMIFFSSFSLTANRDRFNNGLKNPVFLKWPSRPCHQEIIANTTGSQTRGNYLSWGKKDISPGNAEGALRGGLSDVNTFANIFFIKRAESRSIN